MRKVYELNEDWCFIKDFQEEYLKETEDEQQTKGRF